MIPKISRSKGNRWGDHEGANAKGSVVASKDGSCVNTLCQNLRQNCQSVQKEYLSSTQRVCVVKKWWCFWEQHRQGGGRSPEGGSDATSTGSCRQTAKKKKKKKKLQPGSEDLGSGTLSRWSDFSPVTLAVTSVCLQSQHWERLSVSGWLWPWRK